MKKLSQAKSHRSTTAKSGQSTTTSQHCRRPERGSLAWYFREEMAKLPTKQRSRVESRIRKELASFSLRDRLLTDQEKVKVVRQELAKLSPSARPLKDLGADRVQIQVELEPVVRRAIDASAKRRGMTRDEFFEAALRKHLPDETHRPAAAPLPGFKRSAVWLK